MKQRMRMATLWILFATAAHGGDLGGYWATWKAADAGESDGYGVKLALTEQGSDTRIELRGSFFADLARDTDTEELQVIPIELGTRFPIVQEDALTAYLGLGAGYYLMDFGARAVTDEFGYYGLFGLEFRLGKTLFLFGEIQYRVVEAHSDDEAFDLDGLGINAGVATKW